MTALHTMVSISSHSSNCKNHQGLARRWWWSTRQEILSYKKVNAAKEFQNWNRRFNI